MSAESLAARLDALAEAEAFISENELTVAVSNLAMADARDIVERADALGWTTAVFDAADGMWAADTLDDDFGPFRIEIEKPVAPPGVLRLLTNCGFADWLDREEERTHWQICRLDQSLATIGMLFSGWNDAPPASLARSNHKSPRMLVREYADITQVPSALDRWLLGAVKDVSLDNPSIRLWANKAARALILCLPDERDNETLRFKGPPRLGLELPGDEDVIENLRSEGFADLQHTLRWVFEIERETEMRHLLLATEIARSGGRGDQAIPFLANNLVDALESAKTAYQIQLAGMSSDSLKTLAELRKSVGDEIAKLSDATRQIIASVASALAIGIGLIAARLTTTASPWLIAVVMGLAAAYVAITISSGVLFLLLQRSVRSQWQSRLYRFLSTADYDALVGKPARLAERALWAGAWIGGMASAAMSASVFILAFESTPPKHQQAATPAAHRAIAAKPIAVLPRPIPASASHTLTQNAQMPIPATRNDKP